MLISEHFAVDGGNTDPLDDLFVWGIFIALLSRAGFDNLSASLAEKGQEVYLFQNGITQPIERSLQDTAKVTITWNPNAHRTLDLNIVIDGQVQLSTTDSLKNLFKKDLVRTWRLNEVARTLHTSTRNLQRTRVTEAQTLIQSTCLSLTEIAFCVGFSDLAHFSRTFRRYLDVPPIAYRDLISKKQKKL